VRGAAAPAATYRCAANNPHLAMQS
jgi:hypothetical protein